MKKFGFLIGIGLIFLAFFTFYSGGNSETYISQTQVTIDERLQFLRTSDSSPFQRNNIEFQTPKFFAIKPEYRVNAKLERINTRERLTIQNSDGTSVSYQKYAYAKFKLKGADLKLLILKPIGFGALEQYFLGFADDTSGESTYGAGRYLDVEIGKSNKVVLDFNLAYNPYCAYGDGFTCPFPPKENVLAIQIKPREKDFIH